MYMTWLLLLLLLPGVRWCTTVFASLEVLALVSLLRVRGMADWWFYMCVFSA
jgi:hypothetical protein